MKTNDVIAWATAATAAIVLLTFLLQLVREIERRRARKVADVRAELQFEPGRKVFYLVIQNQGPAAAEDVAAVLTKENAKGAQIPAWPHDLRRDLVRAGDRWATNLTSMPNDWPYPRVRVTWSDLRGPQVSETSLDVTML